MRKSQLGYIVFLVIILIFSLGAIFGRIALRYVAETTADELAETNVIINEVNISLDQLVVQSESFYEVSDYGFIFMVIFYAIVCFLFSLASKSSNFFLVLNFIFLLFVMISAIYIKDAYNETKSINDFEADFNHFPITNAGMNFLPHIVIIIWLIGLVVGQSVGG